MEVEAPPESHTEPVDDAGPTVVLDSGFTKAVRGSCLHVGLASPSMTCALMYIHTYIFVYVYAFLLCYPSAYIYIYIYIYIYRYVLYISAPAFAW